MWERVSCNKLFFVLLIFFSVVKKKVYFTGYNLMYETVCVFFRKNRKGYKQPTIHHIYIFVLLLREEKEKKKYFFFKKKRIGMCPPLSVKFFLSKNPFFLMFHYVRLQISSVALKYRRKAQKKLCRYFFFFFATTPHPLPYC